MFKALNIAPGVDFINIKADKFKSNHITVNFITKLTENNGAVYSILPRIMSRGCERFPATEVLASELQLLYDAELSADRSPKIGEFISITFGISVLDDSVIPEKIGNGLFQEAFEILLDVIFFPYMPDGYFYEPYVKRETEDHLDSVKAQINSPDSYAVMRLYDEMCSGEAYGIRASGTACQILSVEKEALHEAYTEMITDFPVKIIAVGKIDEDYVISSVRKRFEKWRNQDKAKDFSLAVSPFRLGCENVKYIKEKMKFSQSHIVMGFRTGMNMLMHEYASHRVFSELFGGDGMSKLFTNVRERLGLCYSCSAASEPYRGTMVVTAGISADNYEVLKNAVLNELEAAASGVISDEECKTAIRRLTFQFRQIADSPAELDMWYLTRSVYGDMRDPEELAEEIAKVDISSVVNAARAVKLDTVYLLNGTFKEALFEPDTQKS